MTSGFGTLDCVAIKDCVSGIFVSEESVVVVEDSVMVVGDPIVGEATLKLLLLKVMDF